MTKRKLTIQEARKIVKQNLKVDKLGSHAIRTILREILPFSWVVYCRDRNIDPHFKMDDQEKFMRRSEEKTLRSRRKKR